VGAHASLFAIDGKAYTGISPRLSMRYLLNDGLALKAGYSRAYQYVHQVSQSYISLPTDQWIPITSSFKPQSCDKISVAANWLIGDKYAVSLEGYYKWMHNIVEYRDEYYLMSPLTPWEARLTSGKGSAKGVDFKISREVGKLSGHIAYSLLWADRTFAEKNGGETFPARCDNRHKINVLLNWQVSKKWEINASWTGMTGNRMTLPTQVWQAPSFGEFWDEGVALVTKVNNYRLPFYHRLDLAFIRHTHNGFWTFSLYNAYCNMNTVAVVRGYSDTYLESITDYGYFYKNKPVFKQLRLLPIIPSISYTWKF
jgi:outer membrane receptor protein involved in Fe transport